MAGHLAGKRYLYAHEKPEISEVLQPLFPQEKCLNDEYERSYYILLVVNEPAFRSTPHGQRNGLYDRERLTSVSIGQINSTLYFWLTVRVRTAKACARVRREHHELVHQLFAVSLAIYKRP